MVEGLRAMSSSRRWLLPVPLAGTLVLLVVAGLTGGGVHPVLGGAALLLAVAAALLPAGSAPLFLLLYLSGYWALTVPDRLGVAVLGGAADLAVVHVAATLSAYGPAGLRLPSGLLRRWGQRLLALVAAAAGTWLAALAFGSVDGAAASTAVVVGLLTLAIWVAYLLQRLGVFRDSEV